MGTETLVYTSGVWAGTGSTHRNGRTPRHPTHLLQQADNVFSYQFNFQFSKRFRRGLETLESCNETITEAECGHEWPVCPCPLALLSSTPRTEVREISV